MSPRDKGLIALAAFVVIGVGAVIWDLASGSDAKRAADAGLVDPAVAGNESSIADLDGLGEGLSASQGPSVGSPAAGDDASPPQASVAPSGTASSPTSSASTSSMPSPSTSSASASSSSSSTSSSATASSSSSTSTSSSSLPSLPTLPIPLPI